MMRIDSAFPSPRIANGIICWYEGDEFQVSLWLDLKDADGESVVLTAADSVEVDVKNDRQESVKKFEFSDVENNTVTLVFDNDVTALFKAGTYYYDIRLSGTYNTTAAKNNIMKVE